MGYGSRLPDSNDLPREENEENPYIEETDILDETALLLSSDAKRCRGCGIAARLKYLEKGLCPRCRDDGK